MKVLQNFLICLCVTALSVSCTREKTAQYVEIKGNGQGGIYSVKYDGSRTAAVEQTIAEGISAIYKEIDKSISSFDTTSILYRHNRGESVSPDQAFLDNKSFGDSMLVKTSSLLNYRAAGIFSLWRNAIINRQLPTQQEIKDARADTSKYSFLAIGQGYTADRIGKFLESKGISNYLVSNGGELLASGVNQDGLGWCIGIEAPVRGLIPATKFVGRFRVPANKKCGISTSGHYRQFAKIADKYYTHVIDTRTGWPVQNTLASATIVANTSIEADALSSYCLMIGKDAALQMIESTPGVEGCVVDNDGIIFCSSGFKLE